MKYLPSAVGLFSEGVMSSEHKQITVEKDNDGIERRKINDIAEHTLYV